MSAVSAVRRAAGGIGALGLGAIGVAVVLTAVGLGMGWVELTIPGLALCALLLGALALTFGRSTYAVRLELAKNRVRIGERAYGRVVVENVGRRRLRAARVTLPVGVNAADFELPSLAAGRSFDDAFVIPTARRGVVPVGPVRSSRGDPFGLLQRSVRWTEEVPLYVHPATVHLGAATAGLVRDLDGSTSAGLSDSDISFHALREYVSGDDRRNIHWRSTARLGKLMIRQFEDTRRTRLGLGIDPSGSAYRGQDDLELAVSVFASIGVQTLRDGRPLTALAGDGELRTGSPGLLLDDCAALVRTDAENGAALVARAIATKVDDASLAVLVTGGAVPLATALESVASLARGVRVVVLACEAGADVELGGRGSVGYARIGRLSDLAQALRRVGAR